MTRNTALKMLNPVTGALAVSQILSGLLHDFIPRQTFDMVHKSAGVAFAAAIVLHVALNWNWVRTNYTKRNPAAGG